MSWRWTGLGRRRFSDRPASATASRARELDSPRRVAHCAMHVSSETLPEADCAALTFPNEPGRPSLPLALAFPLVSPHLPRLCFVSLVLSPGAASTAQRSLPTLV